MCVLVIIRSRRSGDAWLPSSMEVTGVVGPADGRRPGKEAETGYDHSSRHGRNAHVQAEAGQIEWLISRLRGLARTSPNC